jgi:hypothetical protein
MIIPVSLDCRIGTSAIFLRSAGSFPIERFNAFNVFYIRVYSALAHSMEEGAERTEIQKEA